MRRSLWYQKHRPRVPERVCPAHQTRARKQSSCSCSTARGSDGTHQRIHDGAPLYTFLEDNKAGAWNPSVNATEAIRGVDRSTVGLGAVCKGLAMGHTAPANFLYATNFHSGAVEMFGAHLQPAGSFTDATLSSDPRTGTFLGQLKDRSGTPLTISGL